MPRIRRSLNAALWFALGMTIAARVPAMLPAADCRTAGAGIPFASDEGTSGSVFARRVAALQGPPRDAEVRGELLAGHLPLYLRRFAPVTLSGRSAAGAPLEVTLCVMPDYLAVGSDDDALLVPMGLPTALELARRFGLILPTPRMVDAIYDAATVKLNPAPLPASDQMRTTAYVVRHNELIIGQREALHAPQGALTAGDKKDLVLTDRLLQRPGRVAIYGWHRASNQPIQPLSTVHGERYADYSHGVRLVSRLVYVNGAGRAIEDALRDPDLAAMLIGAESLVAIEAQGLLRVLQQRNPR